MTTDAPSTFRYLNRDNLWPGFHLHGLERGADGTVRLAALPMVEGELPAGLADLAAPAEPAGVAVGPDGSVYFSDPDGFQIYHVDSCDGCSAPQPCVGGAGDAPGRLNLPRGLLYLPIRQALLVADWANHRVQLFHLPDFQVVDIWGGRGNQAGQFRSPVALAADAAGNVYVVDDGVQASEVGKQAGQRALIRPGIQKFDPFGRVVPGFAARVRRTMKRQHLELGIPSGVAVGAVGQGKEAVYVLDAAARKVFVYSTRGDYRQTIDLAAAALPTGPEAMLPMGLAVDSDSVYVGDNGGRRVLRFRPGNPGDPDDPDGTFVGAAVGFSGPVAALAGDGQGGLLVHTGQVPDAADHMSACDTPQAAGAAHGKSGDRVPMPLRLAAGAGYARSGFMWGGPFANPSFRAEQWHRIRAMVERPGPGDHVQIFVFSSSEKPGPSTDPAAAVPPWQDPNTRIDLLDCVAPLQAGPRANGSNGAYGSEAHTAACRGSWVRVPLDAPETMLPGRPVPSDQPGKPGWQAEALWIGVELSGEGTSSPVLDQIRVDFDHATLLAHLPAIYQEDRRARRLLARFLTLFQSNFEDIEAEIERLPAFFDPQAAPGAGLDWLAGWLAVDISEDWSVAHKRRAIAEAFALYGWRGTPEGLRHAIKLATGADVRIEEPIRYAQWWALAKQGETMAPQTGQSVLGVTTMLAASQPQGAVLGTSAVLDGSHLITAEEYGAPLFSDVAHQFMVSMYQGPHYSAGTEAAVRAVIERERPAHTAYHLCVVEPTMRIGVQSRVGVDTIIAGPSLPAGLGEAGSGDLVIGGEPAGRIGEASTIGVDLRIGGMTGT